MIKAKFYIASVGCGVAVIYLHYQMMFQRQMEGKCIKIQKPDWLVLKYKHKHIWGENENEVFRYSTSLCLSLACGCNPTNLFLKLTPNEFQYKQ